MPVNARHNVPAAAKADEEEAEGLHPRVLLAKGAPIMLTSNVATHHGLVNGRHGHLHDIVWRPDADPHKDLPEYLLFVPSSAYSGPFLFHDDKDRPVIPIKPVTRSWQGPGGEKRERTMFPIVLAFAITVHKAQGLTLGKVVLDFSEKDFAVGLSYVAVSRVKSIDGIMFKSDFGMARFQARSSVTRRLRNLDKEKRALQAI